jgi:hypothetical protein
MYHAITLPLSLPFPSSSLNEVASVKVELEKEPPQGKPAQTLAKERKNPAEGP